MAAMLAGFSSKGLPTIPFNTRYIEIGVNILDEQYSGVYNGKQKHADDTMEVLRRAQSCGVHKMLFTAGTLDESMKSLAMTRSMQSVGGFDHLYSTVGVHPTRSTDLADPVQTETIMSGLRQCITDGKSDHKVVAIGECGLDYDRLHFCSKEAQLIGFDLQLDLAAEFDLPMFLHNRNTGGDFTRAVRKNREKMRRGGVVHSFDGDVEEMRELVDMGLYIGINGCSLKTPENLAMVCEIPESRLLLETDAPWCGIKPTHAGHKHLKSDFPRKKNDKYEPGFLVKDRNEPCTMVQVLEVVAAAREADPVALAEIVYGNTETLFFSS